MIKKLLGPILVSAVTVMLIIACRGDVVLEPPPSLVGDYVGVYIYKTGLGDQADSLMQPVTFDFQENLWHMYIDTLSADFNPNVCLCNAWGPYAITDRVRLELNDPDRPAPVPPCDACDTKQSPQGLYALEQPPGGIKLVWIQTVTEGSTSQVITSQLLLTRVTK